MMESPTANWQDLFIISVCTIGFISLSKSLLTLSNWVWSQYLRPTKNLKEHYGSWALVTGCTDGIGKALALDLASMGLNLLLVGRNPAKLESTLNEVGRRCKRLVQIKCIVIDFEKLTGEEVERMIKTRIEGLDVGLLVINAGLAYPYARYFHELDTELLEGVMRVNIEGATWVTRAVLPGMLERKKGAIVFTGSASSVALPSYPLYSLYAATKAYVAMLSKSLSLEYQQYGIDIQCQAPFLVATKMASIRRSSFFIPSPEEYSKASMQWIGHQRRLCTPYSTHALLWALLLLLPDFLLNLCALRYFLGMRKRGLRKDSLKATATMSKY